MSTAEILGSSYSCSTLLTRGNLLPQPAARWEGALRPAATPDFLLLDLLWKADDEAFVLSERLDEALCSALKHHDLHSSSPGIFSLLSFLIDSVSQPAGDTRAPPSRARAVHHADLDTRNGRGVCWLRIPKPGRRCAGW